MIYLSIYLRSATCFVWEVVLSAALRQRCQGLGCESWTNTWRRRPMPRQSPRVAAQLAGAVSDVHADGSTTHDHDHAAAEMAAQSLEAARLEKDARRRGKELEHAEREERAAEYGLGGAASCAKEQSAGRQQQSQLSHAEDASTAAGPSRSCSKTVA